MKTMYTILILGLISNSLFAMGHSYEHIYDPESHYKLYTIHRFFFNFDEVSEMQASPKDAQPYANQIIKLMWEVNGFGDKEEFGWRDIARVIGKVYLAFKIHDIAKDWQGASDYLEIRFKSRRDTGGKIGLEIWDVAADFWKNISGN